MSEQCNYIIRSPLIHKGRIRLHDDRRCKRKASEHGRCWQHHDGTYYCDECGLEGDQ